MKEKAKHISMQFQRIIEMKAKTFFQLNDFSMSLIQVLWLNETQITCLDLFVSEYEKEHRHGNM
ncbi:CLUMA_CG019761, isoform A [Clunio marinus]|uniref:CLUMA_CG019761, isoform A n=1 Tax=Clunio marinus TaxID=568069 RepID=A0A1J1J4E7_9DIPT|nr:CLUMA_CG019761, isoform A [Clunio marinus]